MAALEKKFAGFVTKHAAVMINDNEVNDKLIDAIKALANDQAKANEYREQRSPAYPPRIIQQ